MKSQRVFRRFVSVFALGLFLGMGVLSCGGGGGGGAPPPPLFTQADLTGDWHFNALFSGQDARWDRGGTTVDAQGVATITAFESSDTGSLPPPEGTVFSIHPSTGVVSMNLDPKFRGAMAITKNIVIATIQDNDKPGLIVMQKVNESEGYSGADLAGKNFVYHHLTASLEGISDWEYGYGSIDDGLVAAINEIYRPGEDGLPVGGPLETPVNLGTMTIDETGVLGVQNVPTWKGTVSADKNSAVSTETHEWDLLKGYTLTIMHLIDASVQFAQADLAGVWNMSGLAVSNTASHWGWAYGTASVNPEGAFSFPVWRDSGGGDSPSDFALTLESDGELTGKPPLDASGLHGAVSAGKDFSAATLTPHAGNSTYGIWVMVRSAPAAQ